MNRTVTLNTAFQFASKGVACIASLILVALLTRHLGGDRYGIYVVILAWGGILAVFADFGLFNTGVRELSLANRNYDRVAGSLLTIYLLNTLVWVVPAATALFFLPLSSVVRYGLWIFLANLVVLSAVNSCRAVFQSRLEIKYIAAGDLVGSIVLVALAAFSLTMGLGILSVLIAMVMGSITNFLVLFLYVGRFVRFRLILDPDLVKDLFFKAAPLGVSGLLAMVYAKNGILLMSWTSLSEDVGVFGAAYQVYELIALIPVLFLAVMLPLFSNALQGKDHGAKEEYYSQSFRLLVFVAVPLVAGGFAVAGPLMDLLTGRDFSVFRTFQIPLVGPIGLDGMAATFRVLLCVVGLSFLGQLNGHLMVAGRRQSSLLRVYCLTLPVNVLLNLWLIPRFSFLGAAVSLLLSEIVALCYTTWFVYRTFRMRPPSWPFFQAALACVPMFVYLLFSRGPVILVVAVAAVAYGAALFLIAKFPRPERSGPESGLP